MEGCHFDVGRINCNREFWSSGIGNVLVRSVRNNIAYMMTDPMWCAWNQVTLILILHQHGFLLSPHYPALPTLFWRPIARASRISSSSFGSLVGPVVSVEDCFAGANCSGSITLGLNGHIPVAFHAARMFFEERARSRMSAYTTITLHFVTLPSSLFSSRSLIDHRILIRANITTSRPCNACVVWGELHTIIMRCAQAYWINWRVQCDLCPSRKILQYCPLALSRVWESKNLIHSNVNSLSVDPFGEQQILCMWSVHGCVKTFQMHAHCINGILLFTSPLLLQTLPTHNKHSPAFRSISADKFSYCQSLAVSVSPLITLPHPFPTCVLLSTNNSTFRCDSKHQWRLVKSIIVLRQYLIFFICRTNEIKVLFPSYGI